MPFLRIFQIFFLFFRVVAKNFLAFPAGVLEMLFRQLRTLYGKAFGGEEKSQSSG